MASEFNYFFFYALLLAFLAQSAWLVFRSWPGSSRARTAAIRIVLVVLSLLAAFVFAEGYFFFFVDVTDGTLLQLVSYRWRVRHLPQPPGTYRGRPLPEPGTDAGQRYVVAVVGDSVTYGQGIERAEDLYPSILEKKLRESGLDATVYNISYMGWNTFEEWNALQETKFLVPRFDVVILGYCLNDIDLHVRYSEDFWAAMKRLTTPPALLRPLVRRSFAASWLYNKYVLLTAPALNEGSRNQYEAYRNPEAFAGQRLDLLKFKGLVETLKARLFVAVLPDCTVPWDAYPNRDIHRQLSDFWKTVDVPAVDLLEDFQHYPYRELHVSRMDAHPNAIAHRIAAERIFQLLVREHAIPGNAKLPR